MWEPGDGPVYSLRVEGLAVTGQTQGFCNTIACSDQWVPKARIEGATNGFQKQEEKEVRDINPSISFALVVLSSFFC
jgi:hypothetical protein